MRKILFLITIAFNLLFLFANAQKGTLFFINLQERSQKVIEVMDSGKPKFYDINDSFLFTSDDKGNYRLFGSAGNKIKKGRIKLKKPFQKSPIVYSEFRGNSPHVGISQSNLFSEYHIDESINYMGGGTVGDILKLHYIPKYNSVLLHLLIYKDPELYNLVLFPSFAVKKGKDFYINVPTLVITPTGLYESKDISNIRVHEESAKTAFLSNDSVLVVFDLKNTTHRNDFYDIGRDFDFGFYNEDSLLIVQSDGRASMLSLPNHQSRKVYSTEYLADMQNFQIVGRYLFCTKGNTLYINQITDCIQQVENNEILTKCVQPVEEYSFNSKIISYKVSKDGTKLLIHTKE